MSSSSRPPDTLGIRHIALVVSDIEKAEAFYCGALGYRVEWRPDAENVYLTRDSDNLALHKGAREGKGSLDHFGIMLPKAEAVDAWAGYLKEKGVPLVKEPKTHRDGARSFYIQDPEGNTIQFIHHPPISA